MHSQPVSEKTADLVGQDGFAAVPTTALDLHLVQLLPQSRRLMDLGIPALKASTDERHKIQPVDERCVNFKYFYF